MKKDISYTYLENLFSPSEIFHEASKMHDDDLEYYSWINQVNNNTEIRKIISKPYSHHRGTPSIKLPVCILSSDKAFIDIIKDRRSNRDFSNEFTDIQSLSNILYVGNGITSEFQDENGTEWNFRTAPSGGGLFPIDMYCLINNVENVSSGIYFYNNKLHSIEQIKEKDIREELIRTSPTLSDSINNCSFCILLSATFPRIKFKYKERAYRFALLEAGHIAQNILLASVAENHGAIPVGGFLDDEANKIINIDGVNSAVLYLIIIGKK